MIDECLTLLNHMKVLTTLPRREWATTRGHIVSSSDHNRTALDVVDGETINESRFTEDNN